MPCLFLTATYSQRVLSPGTSARPGDLACQTCLPCLLTMCCLVLWKFSVLGEVVPTDMLFSSLPWCLPGHIA